MNGRRLRAPWSALLLILPALVLSATGASGLEVQEFALDNGIRFLVVQRPGAPLVSAAWSARVGSGDEIPGKTGVSHLLEHMMFRGSRTIGTRNSVRELEIMDRLEGERRGGARAERRRARLEEELRSLRIPGEYALLYNRAGALGLDALTHRDFTLYDVRIPPSKLEVWFWMESDRLLAPVFRDLGNEADVVLQEERQRTASAVADVRRRFDEAYWSHHYGPSHPYSWSTGGREQDIRGLGRVELREHFDAHYRGEGLTIALVGDVELEEVKALAESYFGRLPRRSETDAGSPPEWTEREPLRFAETCRCADQVELRFRTVAFSHEDRHVLDVIAGLLNGRTGRLQGLLSSGVRSASAQHAALRRDGTFSVFAASNGASTGELEELLSELMLGLARDPVSERELETVKNQLTTSAWKQLRSSSALARRLLVYDALGTWRDVTTSTERVSAVTVADIQRVAKRYFGEGPSAVAVLRRGASP